MTQNQSKEKNEEEKLIADVVQRLVTLEKDILSNLRNPTSDLERVKRIIEMIEREDF